MLLTRHVLLTQDTMFGSSGCRALSSSLTSLILALWSSVNCSATILLNLPIWPNTALQSPRLATYNVLFQITPTRQQHPVVAIVGSTWNSLSTIERKPSSVAAKALLRTSSSIVPFSWASAVKKCVFSCLALKFSRVPKRWSCSSMLLFVTLKKKHKPVLQQQIKEKQSLSCEKTAKPLVTIETFYYTITYRQAKRKNH